MTPAEYLLKNNFVPNLIRAELIDVFANKQIITQKQLHSGNGASQTDGVSEKKIT